MSRLSLLATRAGQISQTRAALQTIELELASLMAELGRTQGNETAEEQAERQQIEAIRRPWCNRRSISGRRSIAWMGCFTSCQRPLTIRCWPLPPRLRPKRAWPCPPQSKPTWPPSAMPSPGSN